MKPLKVKIFKKNNYYVIKTKKLFWWEEMKIIIGHRTCHRGLMPITKDLHFDTEQDAKEYLKKVTVAVGGDNYTYGQERKVVLVEN